MVFFSHCATTDFILYNSGPYVHTFPARDLAPANRTADG